MKILHVAPENYPVPATRGGAVETLIEGIVKQSSKNKCYSVSIRGNKQADNGFIQVQINALFNRTLTPARLFWNTSLYSYAYQKEVWKKISQLKPDVVHIHNRPQFSVYIAKKFPEIKIIIHLHNEYLSEKSSRPFTKKLIDKINKTNSIVISVSSYINNSISEYCTLRRHIVLNGIEEAKNELHQHEEMKDQRSVILYAGRIVREKGVEDLIELARHLNDDKYLIKIAGSTGFIGDKTADYERKINAEAAKFRNIKMLGFVNREILAGHQNNAKYIVVPSRWNEPCALSVIEGMHSDALVIATDSGGNRELILDDNCIYQINNFEQLLSKIKWFDSNPIEYEIAKQRQKSNAKKRLTLSTMIKNLESVYAL